MTTCTPPRARYWWIHTAPEQLPHTYHPPPPVHGSDHVHVWNSLRCRYRSRNGDGLGPRTLRRSVPRLRRRAGDMQVRKICRAVGKKMKSRCSYQRSNRRSGWYLPKTDSRVAAATYLCSNPSPRRPQRCMKRPRETQRVRIWIPSYR